MTDRLPAALIALADSGAKLSWAIGVVTNTSPFTVQIHGDTVDIVSPPRCSTYTPALNDIVFVLRPASGFLVIDQIV